MGGRMDVFELRKRLVSDYRDCTRVVRRSRAFRENGGAAGRPGLARQPGRRFNQAQRAAPLLAKRPAPRGAPRFNPACHRPPLRRRPERSTVE